MSTIAERFLQLRGKTKQGDFAQLLGVNPNTLRSYENGRSIPNQELLQQICVQFSVSSDWLLLGHGTMRAGDPVPAMPEAAPDEPSQAQESACPRCAKLEARLDETERERRELTAEVRLLWKENGVLREKCARLEERAISHGNNNVLGSAG